VERTYEGGFSLDGEATALQVAIFRQGKRTRQLSGLLWIDSEQYGLAGRTSRDSERLVFWTFLSFSEQLRFEGTATRHGLFFEGKVSLVENWETRSTGTFRIRRVISEGPPPA
jgi:hypothetical protein